MTTIDHAARAQRASDLLDVLTHLDDHEWSGRPACADMDPELFWPVSADGEHPAHQVARAKSVCRACPVQASCLRWAMRHERDGIWGGTSRSERDRMRAARREAAQTAVA